MTGYHGAGRPEKLEAGSGIPARERTGRDGRTLIENDGSVRSFTIDQAALFRDDPPAPIRKKTRAKRALGWHTTVSGALGKGSVN